MSILTNLDVSPLVYLFLRGGNFTQKQVVMLQAVKVQGEHQFGFSLNYTKLGTLAINSARRGNGRYYNCIRVQVSQAMGISTVGKKAVHRK